jgi:hypothetical protein
MIVLIEAVSGGFELSERNGDTLGKVRQQFEVVGQTPVETEEHGC